MTESKGIEIMWIFVFFTYATHIMNYFLSVYSPGTILFVADDGNAIQYVLSKVVLNPDFSIASLALFSFSLIIMNFFFTKAIFLYPTVVVLSVLSFIPMPEVFKAPIYIGVLLAAYMGMTALTNRQPY